MAALDAEKYLDAAESGADLKSGHAAA